MRQWKGLKLFERKINARRIFRVVRPLLRVIAYVHFFMIFHRVYCFLYRVIFLLPFSSVPHHLLPPPLIGDEGSYSYRKTKCHIPQVTGLVHLLKLLTCREQFFWSWQDKAVCYSEFPARGRIIGACDPAVQHSMTEGRWIRGPSLHRLVPRSWQSPSGVDHLRGPCLYTPARRQEGFLEVLSL